MNYIQQIYFSRILKCEYILYYESAIFSIFYKISQNKVIYINETKKLKFKLDNYLFLISMINHSDILKDELRKINNHVSKKYTTIKKELQKTIQVFETNIPVFPYEVCFGLFKLIAESNSSTNCLAMLPFFQAVVNLGFANEIMMNQILEFMEKIKSISLFSNNQVQVKVQQLLLLLISKNSIKFENLLFVYKLINLVFSLENSKNMFIKKNSVSSIIQIILLLINQTKEKPEFDELLVKFLKQFLLLSDNIRPQWYDDNLPPEKQFAVYILSQIIQEPYFKQQKEKFEKFLVSLITVTHKNLSLLMKSSLKESRDKREVASINLFFLLYIRCISRTSKLLGKNFEFLEEIIKQMTNPDNFTLKFLSHETIFFLFDDYEWLYSLIQSPQNQYFSEILTKELNQTKRICSDQKLDLLNLNQESSIKQIINSNDTEYIYPQFSQALELKLIIKDIESITFSLYSIYQQVFKIPLIKKCKQNPILKIFNQCQKIVYDIIKMIIVKEMSESLLQSVLKIIEKFINISGCFGDYKVCGVYIKIICKYCLPSEFKLIDYRHVQINKMVLNTANCLGNLLDTSSWMIIWKAFQNYQSYYNKYLLSKETNQYLHQRQNDVQILYQSLDSIFTESIKYDDQYLMIIIDSLVQVTYECLENNFNDESKKIFSFQRIGQIYRLNLFRLSLIWPSLSSSLLCITTSKISYFRLSALNLLNGLMPLTLSHLSNNPESLTRKFNAQNYQKLIFQPWMNLVKCKFPELKQQIIISLNKIVIDYGHILTYGWIQVLQIIKEIGDFKSMQVIIDTFLDKVDNHIETVIDIIHQFKSSLMDPNQKYLCLTFLWTIGDHSAKLSHISLLKRIFDILLEPQFPFVFNPEARHSAFYIFTQLLIHNCNGENIEFWQQIFLQIQKYTTYITEQLKKLNDQKIIEEAGKNILLNTVKIYKKYFSVIQKQNRPDEHKLDLFYSLIVSIFELKNTDLYVLALKQIKQILILKLEISVQLQSFKKLIRSLTQSYVVSNDLKIMKCLICYMPPEIFQFLTKCLLNLKHLFHDIYKLMEKIFLLRLQAEQKEVKITSSRIYFEEKLIIEFMKNFINKIIEQKEAYLEIFNEKFIMTLERLLLYEDYNYIRKFVPYVVMMIHQLTNQALIHKYLIFLKKISSLKYNLNLLKKQGQTKDMPIWHLSMQELIKISTQWIKKKKYGMAHKIYLLFQEFLSEKQQKTQTLIKWTTPETLGIYFQNEVFLLNYVTQQFILSLNFKEISQEQIVNFAQIIYLKSKVDDSDSNIISYSRMNLQLLFKLCNYKDGILYKKQEEKLIFERIAVIVYYLFKRIIEIFEDYFNAEKKFGSLPMTQKFISNLIFIITKMDKLELPQDIFSFMNLTKCRQGQLDINILSKTDNQLLSSKKAHLIYFHKQFSQCITSKESDIRLSLSNIFETIGKMLIQ